MLRRNADDSGATRRSEKTEHEGDNQMGNELTLVAPRKADGRCVALCMKGAWERVKGEGQRGTRLHSM